MKRKKPRNNRSFKKRKPVDNKNSKKKEEKEA